MLHFIFSSLPSALTTIPFFFTHQVDSQFYLTLSALFNVYLNLFWVLFDVSVSVQCLHVLPLSLFSFLFSSLVCHVHIESKSSDQKQVVSLFFVLHRNPVQSRTITRTKRIRNFFLSLFFSSLFHLYSKEYRKFPSQNFLDFLDILHLPWAKKREKRREKREVHRWRAVQ